MQINILKLLSGQTECFISLLAIYLHGLCDGPKGSMQKAWPVSKYHNGIVVANSGRICIVGRAQSSQTADCFIEYI